MYSSCDWGCDCVQIRLVVLFGWEKKTEKNQMHQVQENEKEYHYSFWKQYLLPNFQNIFYYFYNYPAEEMPST